MSHRSANRFKGGPSPSTADQRIAQEEARRAAATAAETRLVVTRHAMGRADLVAGDEKPLVEALRGAALSYQESPSPDNYRKLKAAVDACELRSSRWTEVFNLEMEKGKSLGQQLVESMQEVVAISGGDAEPAQVHTIESPVEWLTLPEAGLESGLAASTLRKQILNGRIKATKQGRDWLVARKDLMTYLENRDPRGKPARSLKARRAKP